MGRHMYHINAKEKCNVRFVSFHSSIRSFDRSLTSVVDDVVLDVVRQALSGVDPFLQLGVGDVPRHHDRARQAQPCPHGVPAEELANIVHRLVQVYLDHLRVSVSVTMQGVRISASVANVRWNGVE